MRTKDLSIGAVIVIALLALSLAYLGEPAHISAAPGAAPTPVANILTADAVFPFNFQVATALTADTNTSSREVMRYNAIDVQYVIDQGTTNTTTLTIQWSNDGSNWVAGPALVSNNAADATDITRVPVFGRYARINQNVTNSNPITITLLGIARQ